MILSRAWLHDTVSCAAWNDARKGVYLKPLFKTPCSNCYWGWSKPIMLDYRDISLMESVPLMWGPVTASPVRFKPMTILEGGGPPYNWYPIHNGENSTFGPGWPPNTPYACAEARRTQVADATFRDKPIFWLQIWPEKRTSENAQVSERVSTQVNRWAYRCTHLYQHVRMQVCMWARIWFHIHSFTVQHTPPHITTPFCLIPCLLRWAAC